MMKASDPNHESNFHTATKTIELPVEQTGFVLVDMWDASGLPREIWPGGVSFCERALQVTREAIVPALDAARAIGMTVVHAPTANVSENYPDVYSRVEGLDFGPTPAPPARDWPPMENRSAWSREMWVSRYSQAYTAELSEIMYNEMRIIPEAEPIEDEWLIGSSDHMHAICKREGLLNLLYVGFATNMCLLFKPGALYEMSRAGYRCVVLRDCTTAVENADTHDGLDMTRVFCEWFEMQALAYTSLSTDFVEACEKA